MKTFEVEQVEGGYIISLSTNDNGTWEQNRAVTTKASMVKRLLKEFLNTPDEPKST